MRSASSKLRREFRLLLISSMALFSFGCAAQQIVGQRFGNQITSHPISLDVTVLDRSGEPVTTALSSRDFLVTEDKQPEKLLSCEAPVPMAERNSGLAAESALSRTVILLDLLNSDASDAAVMFSSVRSFLASGPDHLATPTELLVLGDTSLQMAIPFTRDRAQFKQALGRVPEVPSLKARDGGFAEERYRETITALREIALQNRGLPGRANVIWLGRGGPNLDTRRLQPGGVGALLHEAHETSNLLVYSRTALFLVFPSITADFTPAGDRKPIGIADAEITEMAAQTNIGAADPFGTYWNFGVFVNVSGGAVFAGHNDLGMQIGKALTQGSSSYVLTYQPSTEASDERFRRIRVSLRDPSLRAVAQTGYFMPDQHAPAVLQKDTVSNLTEGVQSRLTYEALPLSVERVSRHPDADTVEFIVQLKLNRATWEPTQTGKSFTSYRVAIASLGVHREVLRSKLESLESTVPTQDPSRLSREVTLISEVIKVPRQSQSVRVLVEDDGSGRVGAVEVDRTTLKGAPPTPSAQPKLVPHL